MCWDVLGCAGRGPFEEPGLASWRFVGRISNTTPLPRGPPRFKLGQPSTLDPWPVGDRCTLTLPEFGALASLSTPGVIHFPIRSSNQGCTNSLSRRNWGSKNWSRLHRGNLERARIRGNCARRLGVMGVVQHLENSHEELKYPLNPASASLSPHPHSSRWSAILERLINRGEQGYMFQLPCLWFCRYPGWGLGCMHLNPSRE